MFNNRFNISLPLAASLTALGLAALVTVIYLWGVASAVIGPGMDDEQPDALLAKYIERHEQQMQTYTERFNGRSMFYIPPQRPAPSSYEPPPPRPKQETVETGPPPEPVKTRGPYMGPTVAFAVGSEVWFQPPGPNQPQMSLRVGETAHGVTLKEVRLPAQVVVEWDGYEYNLDLLGRNFPTEWTSTDTRLTKDHADAEDSVPGLVRVPENGPMPQQMYQPDESAMDQPAEEDISTTRDIEMPRQRPEPMSPEELRREEQQREPDRRPPTGGPVVIGRDIDSAPAESAASRSEQHPVAAPGDAGVFEGPPIPPHIHQRMLREQAEAQAPSDDAPQQPATGAGEASTDAQDEASADDPDAEAAEAEADGASPPDEPERDPQSPSQQPQGAEPQSEPPAVPPEQRASAAAT